MDEHFILVTGDYWNADFQKLLRNLQVPVTMVPIEKVQSVRDSKFDLIVIAQARRDQFSRVEVENLQSLFVNAPIVALLGSWCEGEMRSGTPWPGVVRVYWHQWEGRYEQFVNQLQNAGITDWHAPKNCSVADRIAAGADESLQLKSAAEISYVGVSAWTHFQYEMVADAMNHFGWRSRWVERAVWDGASSVLISVICVDADSWSADLQNRLMWILEEIPGAPIVLLLNYPRQNEWDQMQRAGVYEVVSKPFELQDLKSAIVRAVKNHSAAQTPSRIETNRAT